MKDKEVRFGILQKCIIIMMGNIVEAFFPIGGGDMPTCDIQKT